MKIRIKKLSQQLHEITIIRSDGTSESIECETRNFLKHDFLHFAVESEAKLQRGFWGLLASGKTFTDLADRTGRSIADVSDQIMTIEAVVGSLHNVSELKSAATFINAMKSQGEGLGWEIPEWLSVAFVETIQEKMRRLWGHWNAIRFGETLELNWQL